MAECRRFHGINFSVELKKYMIFKVDIQLMKSNQNIHRTVDKSRKKGRGFNCFWNDLYNVFELFHPEKEFILKD